VIIGAWAARSWQTLERIVILIRRSEID
jgi:hypothetical protein